MTDSRLSRALRRLRPGTRREQGGALELGARLDEQSLAMLRGVVDDVVAVRGGEVAARRRAERIGEAFLTLDEVGQRRFFELLDAEYGIDSAAVESGARDLLDAAEDVQRRRAEGVLRAALQPARVALFRRFIGVESGLAFLVHFRAALRDVDTDRRFRTIDTELRDLLEGWFDVGLLELQRIDWQSPAALLEKLIEYEAVHEIASWDDLRNRLGPDRRCFAFSHPAMPDDLLIFVEVALTEGLANNIVDLIDPSVPDPDPGRADTAIFYSISNCHDGLAGVRLGDFLIKQVVGELAAELPNIRGFATLSPIPGFRSWLETLIADDDPIFDELGALPDSDPRRLIDIVHDALVDPDWYADPKLVPLLREHLPRLGARYLCTARRGTRALDPVANFHLSNGARVERLHFLANPARVGQDRALGMMVNYRYLPERIEENHDRYAHEGHVDRSGEIEALL